MADELTVGCAVIKPKGYPFPGHIRAIFQTASGETRIVVEMAELFEDAMRPTGLLHIFNLEQVRRFNGR